MQKANWKNPKTLHCRNILCKTVTLYYRGLTTVWLSGQSPNPVSAADITLTEMSSSSWATAGLTETVVTFLEILEIIFLVEISFQEEISWDLIMENGAGIVDRNNTQSCTISRGQVTYLTVFLSRLLSKTPGPQFWAQWQQLGSNTSRQFTGYRLQTGSDKADISWSRPTISQQTRGTHGVRQEFKIMLESLYHQSLTFIICFFIGQSSELHQDLIPLQT